MSRPETTIYRDDHIVGQVGVDLTPDLYRCWGRSLARLSNVRDNIIVGSDGRESSPAFRKALMEGFNDMGVNVIDLGEVPNVALYYSARRLRASGFVYVTGFTYPYDFNGLIWLLEKQSLSHHDQIQAVRKDVESDLPSPYAQQRGSVKTANLLSDWLEWHHSIWYDTPPVPFRIVVDPIHSAWTRFFRKALQVIFPHALIEAIHDEPDGRFQGLIPFCRNLDTIKSLCSEVDIRRADMGFAIDPGSACFTLVDNHGIPFSINELSWLILQSFAGGIRGEKIVHTTIFPKVLANEVLRLGGELVWSPMQREAFLDTMLRTKAFLGFDYWGRYATRSTGGYTISFFAVCWLIDFLSRMSPRTSLSTLRKSFPKCFASQEMRVPWIKPDDVANALTEKWNVEPERTGDGIQFSGPHGRVHQREIRNDGTLGLFFEADDHRMLNQMVRECASVLDDLDQSGQTLLEQYRTDIGTKYHLNW